LRRIDAPAVAQQFPQELVPAPRSVAERLFTDIRGWRTEAAGGHSAAWERPDDVAAGLRETVALA
jgi:hypothetical protein